MGIYVDAMNGRLNMVDQEGLIYRFDMEEKVEPASDDLLKALITDQAVPLQHMAMGYGAGLRGNDQLFLLAPDRDGNHVIGRTLTPLGDRHIFAGRGTFDDGVGPLDGETLSPLVLAYGRAQTRLVVLEEQGRIQVLDAQAEDVERRFITQWGRFGAGEGDFQVSPPTSVSVVVDSEGQIYVADGEERIQVFVP